MGVFLTLVRRELGAAFNSLTGYVVVAITLLLAGFGLMDIVQRLNSDRTPSPIPEIFFADGIVFWLILILTTPVITMRTFAAEKALGTYEALMTTPVGEWQVVLAKFTGSLVFYLLSWAPLIGVLIVLRQVTQQPQLLDPWAMCGVLTGIACIGSTFLSIGVFASSLTRSQIIAAMTSLLIGIGMWMALVMAFNVWFIIWPAQQKILGLVEATAEEKAAAAPKALYASRFNTMFSIGMLYCMVAQQNAPV